MVMENTIKMKNIIIIKQLIFIGIYVLSSLLCSTHTAFNSHNNPKSKYY